MTATLTHKQRAIYDFVVDCVRAHGIPPSLIEIADAFDLNSLSGVSDHLRALERKGFIRRRRGVSRGIELVDIARTASSRGAVQVPVIGSLPSSRRLGTKGTPRRHLMFDGRVAQKGAFAVRVNIAGLESRGILNGDYLIVIGDRPPRAGDLALAHVQRTTVLVERLPAGRGVKRVDDEVEWSEGFAIFGKVVAVLRSMDETAGT